MPWGALTGEDAQRAGAPPGQRRRPDDLVRLARIRECRARVAGHGRRAIGPLTPALASALMTCACG
jgi:hypothetical protein